MNWLKSCAKKFVLIISFFTLLSCSTTPQFGALISESLSRDSYNIKVRLTVPSTLNPTQHGRPSPLLVRLVQLKDSANFQNKDSSELLSKIDSSLGTDLIEFKETMLFPGKDQEFELKVNSDTKYLGMVAAFQQEEGIGKKIISIEGQWSRNLCVEFSDTSITRAERCA